MGGAVPNAAVIGARDRIVGLVIELDRCHFARVALEHSNARAITPIP